MKISRFSSIMRPLDPEYPTNLAIMLLTLVVVIVASIVQGLSAMDWLSAVVWGLGAGFNIMLTWALARELDPDHDYSAFVGVALVIIALFIWDLPGIAVLVWLLLLLRIINRSFGYSATLLDALGVLAIGAWLAYREHSIFIVMTAVGLLLDGLIKPANRKQIMSGIFGGAISVLLIAMRWAAWTPGGLSLQALGMAAGMGVVFLPVVIRSSEIHAVGDNTGSPLQPERVIAGQIYILVVGLLVVFLGGWRGLQLMLSFWAAVMGAALYLIGAFLVWQFRK